MAKWTYRKTYDIYSLEILLLELAYWQPVQDFLRFPDQPAKEGDAKLFREQLLAPSSKYVKELSARVGDKIPTAIMACLEGEKAFDI